MMREHDDSHRAEIAAEARQWRALPGDPQRGPSRVDLLEQRIEVNWGYRKG
jgi:hypothetical protein